MTATFPSALPAPLLDGYGVDAAAGLEAAQMAAGNVRKRRRFAHVPQVHRVRWRMLRADRVTLSDFVDSTGVDEFWLPLRVPGDPYQAVRSVLARWWSGLTVTPISGTADEVSALVFVEELPIVLAVSSIITPDASAALAPDGSSVQSETLA